MDCWAGIGWGKFLLILEGHVAEPVLPFPEAELAKEETFSCTGDLRVFPVPAMRPGRIPHSSF